MFAREGADVVVSHLSEHEDARETKRLVEAAARQCVLVEGDISKPEQCRALVQKTVDAFDHIDILVNNAAHQKTFERLEDIPDEEWELILSTNLSATFYITKQP